MRIYISFFLLILFLVTPSVQAAMLESQNRVHSMGMIHQKLYQSEHLAAIEMRDYFINLGENIVSSFNAESKIKVECNMPELILDVDTAISIGLIVNELLTNSLKYAFNGKGKGLIKMSLKGTDTEGGAFAQNFRPWHRKTDEHSGKRHWFWHPTHSTFDPTIGRSTSL